MAGIPPIEPYPMPAPTELPSAVVDWQPDPQRAVLLIHDMQQYFLKPFPQQASPRLPLLHNAASLRRRCTQSGVPVAYTAQPGGMSALQRGLLGDFWGPGMRTSPEHRRIVAGLEPAGDDWLFTKWRYSAFFKTDLLQRMRAAGRDQLIICGLYAHVGVLMSAMEAFSHDIQPFVAADAVADFSADHHRLALQYAAQRCAAVLPTARLCDALTAATAHTPC
ncbi:isochorismatase family protein [Streptomyces sp. NPDC050147]|uniref:isochorismatase family protein n=1 Tax=Streptomyces sp. NPDC050147 TaxID=3155513 RepID=UPI003416A5EE